MVEMELPNSPTRWQKQPISVPFLWEAIPGTPKNNWKLVRPSRPPPPPPPHPAIKLVASIPFEWEEKPGKPLPLFNQPRKEFGNKSEINFGNKNGSKDEKETIFESLKLVHSQLANNLIPPPPHRPIKLSPSIPFDWEEKPGKPLPSYPFPTKTIENGIQDDRKMIFESDFDTFSFKTKANRLDPSPPYSPIKLIAWIPFDGDENDSDDGNVSEDEREVISESDSETHSFHTDESFSSVPSLLANHPVQAVNIAHAVPVPETPDAAAGYESDSSISSYATGTTSLVGAPFLERLFPLLSPKLSVLEKVGEKKENNFEDHKTKFRSKDSDWESSSSVAIRRPATLGELIMMSRRRSYIRKAVQIRRHDSMGSMKKGAMGCFMFGIEELQRKMKKQLQLKLI